MLTGKELSIELYRPELADKACRRVEKGEELLPLIEEMTRLMRSQEGTGLAAPQVGVYLRLAILLNLDDEIEVLVNPEIVNLGGHDLLEQESCLSLPPAELATARIWRSEIAYVRSGTVKNPNAAQLKVYRKTMARRVQHEIDHLQGVFFIDRCQPVARGIVLRRFHEYQRQQEIERRANLSCVA